MKQFQTMTIEHDEFRPVHPLVSVAFFVLMFGALVAFAVLPGPSKAQPKAAAQVPTMTATERATIAPAQTGQPTNTAAPTAAPTETQAPTMTALPTEIAVIVPTNTERPTIAPTATANLAFIATEAAVQLQIRRQNMDADDAAFALLVKRLFAFVGFCLALVVLLMFAMGGITAYIRTWQALAHAPKPPAKVAQEEQAPARPTFAQALERARITQEQFNSWLDVVSKTPSGDAGSADEFHEMNQGIFRTQLQAREFYRLLKAYGIVEQSGKNLYITTDFDGSPTA